MDRADVLAIDPPRLMPACDEATRVALAELGRTEDLAFSPSGRQLAIVGHLASRVLLLEVDCQKDAHGANHIRLSSPRSIESSALAYPHGVCWLTDQRFVVANRQGDACLFRLPADMPEGTIPLAPELIIKAEEGSVVHTPGSVCARPLTGDRWEVILCNNFSHELSQHLLEVGDQVRLLCASVLLRRGLEIPDGVEISPDGRWIAVSNHDEHAVRVYRNDPALGPESEPKAWLTGVNYPHGLRFTPDGQWLLVADAGLPFVHVYQMINGAWSGVMTPRHSLRVVGEAAFLRECHNPQEGGPKGLAFVAGQPVLAVTNREQPLAFFDLASILPSAAQAQTGDEHPEQRLVTLARHLQAQLVRLASAEARVSALDAELRRTSQAHQAAMQALERQTFESRTTQAALTSAVDACRSEIAQLHASRSWKLMAPYRQIGGYLRSWWRNQGGMTRHTQE